MSDDDNTNVLFLDDTGTYVPVDLADTDDPNARLLNEALTNQDRIRFFSALTNYPSMKQLWDLEKMELDTEAAQMYLQGCSEGEALLAKFFFMVWLGEDRYSFNLLEAVRKLDSESLEMISNWMINPFWP